MPRSSWRGAQGSGDILCDAGSCECYVVIPPDRERIEGEIGARLLR